jgi:hypothetical protein
MWNGRLSMAVKTVTVSYLGKTYTVPAGLSTKEVVDYIKGVINGTVTPVPSNPYVEPKQDVVVEGKLENKDMTDVLGWNK